MSLLRGCYKRLYGVPKADLVAGLFLFSASLLWAWFSWGRLYDPIVDQGWYLQVSSRLMGGDILYRDMIWMYGPFPVYLLALLFHWLGAHVNTFFFLYYLLAICGCLLSYRVARFLLAPPLALLGTIALFLGGWWGGFVGYTQAYTGAVPLGAVVGLLFVVCLLSYLERGRLFWLIGAGLASGASMLIKPEFAVACVGTGLVILTGLVLFPKAWPMPGVGRVGALGVYAATTAAVAGLSYVGLAYQAGWSNIWAGITGYDQDAILLHVWPPWGMPESWLYILSGLGFLLLAGAVLVFLSVPGAAKKHPWRTILWVGFGLTLGLLPWLAISRINPSLLPMMRASPAALIEQGIRVLWAPGTVLLAILILALGIVWMRAHFRRQPLDRWQVILVTLAIYSALAAIRSFLHPIGTFHFLYLNTLFPVLLFLAAVLLPKAVERWWQTPVRRSRLQAVVVVLLVGYAAAGLVWDADYLSRSTAEWTTGWGTVRYNPDHERRRAWPDLLEQILIHTEPGDPIAVLGQEPGFYFWTDRRNPLRQDTVLPGMETSPGDAQEMVLRLKRNPPRLIAIPQGVTRGRGWFWELDIGRQGYENLAPVWEYVHARYSLHDIVGGDTWGYAVYLLSEGPP